MRLAYQTQLGSCFQGTAEEILNSKEGSKYTESVDLLFTSPPFPLNTKKKYGNLQGQEYIDWLARFGPLFRKILKPQGSLVVEMGNAWQPGRPVMSTLALEALLALKKAGDFELCQQFVWSNPARLPTPAQWVTVTRMRVKDSFTHLWWMSASDRPKADNRRVLKDYSPSMRRLLERQSYNSGRRPSQHLIGKKSFLTKNQGAIPSNVITVANTGSVSNYLSYCRAHDLPRHPARMPIQLAEFFVNFLTEPRDLVLDPFAGSNTTGAAAERLGRRWVAIEPTEDYVIGSRGWFNLQSIVEE